MKLCPNCLLDVDECVCLDDHSLNIDSNPDQYDEDGNCLYCGRDMYECECDGFSELLEDE